jgi:transposase
MKASAEQINEVVVLHRQGLSLRRIARKLSMSRKTVRSIVTDHLQAREKGAPHPDLPRAPVRRPSLLDGFEEKISALLSRYKDITAVRLHEELQRQGFKGGYSIVRERLRRLRPKPAKEPVIRFETAPGVQAQMDYSPYEIDFTAEGRRKVHCFSYVLGYSRRQYIHFVESQDFTTTIRQHVSAFDHMGGVTQSCLYDNLKVVVSGYDDEEPIYNTRFLAFATHYGFLPWACRRRRSKTKGKVERPFLYVETNLLNGRDFHSLSHLNEIGAWWMANVSDVHLHRETKRRPIDLWTEEREHLQPLPATPYDTAVVVYRTVSSEGFVQYAQNYYPVPYHRIGESLPLRITEDEVIIYGKDLVVVARHPVYPRTVTGERLRDPRLHPEGGGSPRIEVEMLRERFSALGPEADYFLAELLESRRYGKTEGLKVLSLLGTYRKVDLLSALRRANQYRAFRASAIERILASQARPKLRLEQLTEESSDHLDDGLKGLQVRPRPTSEYQKLLFDPEEHSRSGKTDEKERHGDPHAQEQATDTIRDGTSHADGNPGEDPGSSLGPQDPDHP